MIINNKDKILNKILSPQEYFLLKHQAPYILDFKKDDQELLCIGVEHSRDPKAKHYLQIITLLKGFLSRHPKDSIMLAIEGFIPPAQKSKNSSIIHYGESGLLIYLAKKYQLNYFCSEPAQNEILKHVFDLNLFKKEDVALWIFLNVLWNTLKTSPILLDKEISLLNTLMQYLDEQLNNKIPHSNGFSLLLLRKRLKEITGSDLLSNDLDSLKKKRINIKTIEHLQNPFIKYTILNDIGSEINYTRDRFIADSLIQKLECGKNIFSVHGINHVVAQEPAFELFFK